MPTYFFTATESANDQITSLYDFVWPTAAAMWNLRWQVAGYLQIVPDATIAQLRARFTEGADVHGANFRRACVDHTWDEQKKAFARVLLINTIAIYEGWVDEVLNALGKNIQPLQKALQFPDRAGGSATGVWAAIGAICAVESAAIKGSFYGAFCRGRHYALPKLNAMMLCYRFFKELRNCDMHRGGVADQRLVEAYNEFLAVGTPASLGVPEVPAHMPPIAGDRIGINLRGIVGFSHIVLKIIATLDAELCRSKNAEKPFIQKWKRSHSFSKMLSSTPGKRHSQITLMAKKAGFPKPSNANQLGNWLSEMKLTTF